MITRDILEDTGVPLGSVAIIINAIGNHDEGSGKVANAVSAAVLIADNLDVRRSRVQETCMENILTDINDLVNYACTRNEIVIELRGDAKVIKLCLDINTAITPVMSYF